MSLPYSIVDVFSAIAYKGNPLAIVDNTADILSTTQMKLIARQFNLSETTFFSRPSAESSAHFALRSFLPDGKEVFGAGHNILGVWWYLAAQGGLNFADLAKAYPDGNEEFEFQQELGGQIMPVRIMKRGNSDYEVILRQATPGVHSEHPDIVGLAKSISLEKEDIGFGDVRKPRVMSTSTTRHLMVPISSPEALCRADVQRERLLEQLAQVDKAAYGIYLFTPSLKDDGVYQARFFSPGMAGEDPATGSAAGPLARYLHIHGRIDTFSEYGEIKVKQGLEIGRECLIKVLLSIEEGDRVKVDIIGSGVEVMKGKIQVPHDTLDF